MSDQNIVRVTGLLVIEAINSNPNGDPDRESDPVSVLMERVKSRLYRLNENCVI